MLDNYRDLIDELLGTPTALRTMLTDAGRDVAAATLGQVSELAERDQLVLQRLQTILREPNAHLRELPAAEERGAMPANGDVATVLSTLDSARGDLVSLLMNLTLKDWERTATHETEGEIALAEEVERHVEFDEAHVARIRHLLGDDG